MAPRALAAALAGAIAALQCSCAAGTFAVPIANWQKQARALPPWPQ